MQTMTAVVNDCVALIFFAVNRRLQLNESMCLLLGVGDNYCVKMKVVKLTICGKVFHGYRLVKIHE